MIYFAHAAGTELVKIGYTAGDPTKRIGSLQTGCPHKLILIATIDGTEQKEAELHESYQADRVNGEWFKMSPRMAVEIARAQIGNDLKNTPSEIEKLKLAVEQLKDTVNALLSSYGHVWERIRWLEMKNETATGNESLPQPDLNNDVLAPRVANAVANTRMVTEMRHHLGDMDINYAAIFCETCDERITEAREGNAYWNPTFTDDKAAFYNARWPIHFVHKSCCLSGGENSIDRQNLFCQSLDDFLIYLCRNVGIEIPKRRYEPEGW